MRLIAALAATLVLLNACKSSQEEDSSGSDSITVVPTLQHNNLAQAENQSSFLLSQAHSPINWQPWSKEVFADAASEQKTVFAFIGSSTNSHSIEFLKKINASPATCARLNQSHVNVLIDADLHPDLAFFSASLNANTGNAISSTQLIWLSYEGIPISWTSIRSSSQPNIHDLISRMSNTVSHLWQDDPNYVLENSREDLSRRLRNITPRPAVKDNPLTPLRAIRQAGSLFDPTSNTIDNMVGLSVARYTELMALASSHPDVSAQQARNHLTIATRTADYILLRSLLDPLDGGVFTGTQQARGKLPIFTKTLSSQIQVMEALYSLYRLTSKQKYLSHAKAVQQYIETSLTLPDKSYSLGSIYAKHGFQDNPCIWTLEEIEASLTEAEAELCIQAFGISGIGNIAISDDRNRNYFRKNTLSWQSSIEELATRSNSTSAALKIKLDSITKKLAKLRTEKSADRKKTNLSTASSTAALASAYISAYRATGDSENLEKAKSILEFIRTGYVNDEGKLQRCRFNGKLLTIPAKGIDYARVSSAALDMHEATLENPWLEWAVQIHQEMNDSLANSDLTELTEASDSNYPEPFNIRAFIAIKPLDNESTWSIVYSNAKRISMRLENADITKQAENLRLRIISTVSLAPLASIDFLKAHTRLCQKVVYLKAPASPEFLKAALPHTCQLVIVTESGSYPELGDAKSSLTSGNAIVIQRGKLIGTAEDPQGLDQLLR